VVRDLAHIGSAARATPSAVADRPEPLSRTPDNDSVYAQLLSRLRTHRGGPRHQAAVHFHRVPSACAARTPLPTVCWQDNHVPRGM